MPKFLLFALVLTPAFALSSPKSFKARCESAITNQSNSGVVHTTEVVVNKGEAKKFLAPDGFQFEIGYGDKLAQVDVLSISAGGPHKIETALSLLIEDKFPRRFDLSVDAGFLTCEIQ